MRKGEAGEALEEECDEQVVRFYECYLKVL
jgi:hypothetical protein